MNGKYAIFALLATALIVGISSMPGSVSSGNGSVAGRIIFNSAHVPAYALITVLWLKAFKRSGHFRFSLRNLLIVFGLVIFAFVDEIHQSFVPGRTASLKDVGLDMVGIFLGLLLEKHIL